LWGRVREGVFGEAEKTTSAIISGGSETLLCAYPFTFAFSGENRRFSLENT
jgi:hypothetical protein